MQASIADEKQQIESYQHEITTLTEQQSSLQDEKASLQEKINKAVETRTQLTTVCSQVEQRQKSLDEKCQQHVQEWKKLEKEKEELACQEQLVHDLQCLHNEVLEKRKEQDQAQRNVENFQILKDGIKRLETQIAEEKKRRERKRNEAIKLKKEELKRREERLVQERREAEEEGQRRLNKAVESSDLYIVCNSIVSNKHNRYHQHDLVGLTLVLIHISGIQFLQSVED